MLVGAPVGPPNKPLTLLSVSIGACRWRRIAIVREFCKRIVMPETKRMAEEANRIGQEAQEQAKRVIRLLGIPRLDFDHIW